MDPTEVEDVAEGRARLSLKGQILYGKYCGTNGRGICAESFALHHIRLGEPTVALDLVRFLEGRIEALRVVDPEGRLAMTEALADRIKGHLAGES